MENLKNQLSLFEDVIELNIPLSGDISDVNFNWVQYNPRKKISRFGCSITSLDGNDSGIPDLDSILEYNRNNKTNYTEKDFNIPTKHSFPFSEFLSNFSVGRSHYIKLDPGGFFPWHRDHDKDTIRVIYTVENCEYDKFIWLEDEKLLKLENRKWYYINTKKKHSVFSFHSSVFAVFNVLTTNENISKLIKHFKII